MAISLWRGAGQEALRPTAVPANRTREAGDRRITPIRKRFVEKKTVLVADGSDGSFLTLRQAFAETKEPHMVRRVRDGNEAVSYVIGEETFSDRQRFPFPDLIIADNSLPKASAIEMLHRIRK